ncbi:PREDICTED: WAT1-related protein At4g30420-like isoform X2 [Populus euphratica]|uniref:WAT1-related protein n=1 Tax=Populus euphratica TaxID=75702 RepID=A0AAJ6TVG5_POPEU|nr:PREDICTED: WAT1-related protein At4g30420-like isoform X2 [Populus euphratica]
MGAFEDSKPVLAMLGMQFSYAIVSLITRAALIQGMSPRVFVVYRQAIATVVIAPLAHFSRKSGGTSMGLRSFSLVFSASLIGVTINQNVFAEGLYLASSSMASAMGNLVPAITFVMAFLIGLEKINIRSFRSIAKIVGTVICVSGAISMALLRGPKLLNTTIFESGGEDWLLGCLLIFASTFCWSIWLILQVPVTASYPDHLSLSAWLCFLATLQSGILTLFLEKDLDAWKLHSYLEVVGCLFTAWVISQRGPLFSAMFNPLCTVIVTILAAIFLHEEIYTGSLIGAVAVIIGLYIVLWGKARDFIKEGDKVDPKLEIDGRQTVKITIEESRGDKPVLEEPLLSDKSNDIEENSNVHQ